MISVVFIVNNEKNFKNFKNINYSELYKKCGYKNNDNFVKLYEKINCIADNSDVNNIYYEYWGKNVGKESFKYKFDNITYYNKLLIIKKDGDKFLNISEDDIALIDESYCANEEVVNNSIEENNNSTQENSNEKLANIIVKEDDEELDNDSNSELSEEPYLFSSDEED
jgi:hypothetical protein